MLIITIIYALLSVLGIGSILNPVLKKCDVLAKSNPEGDLSADDLVSGRERKKCCQGFKQFVLYFDQRYFAPVFIRSQGKNSIAKPQDPAYGDMHEESKEQVESGDTSVWTVNDEDADESRQTDRI